MNALFFHEGTSQQVVLETARGSAVETRSPPRRAGMVDYCHIGRSGIREYMRKFSAGLYCRAVEKLGS